MTTAEELTARRRAGALRKSMYEKTKQKLLELEKENYGHVFLLKTQNDWYKMMAHSALIYLYYVWPIARDRLEMVKRAPKLTADSDFRYKAPIGVINFRNLETPERIILTTGAKKVRVSGVGGENVVAYKLDREMTKDEFWKIRHDEEELWNKANTIITPNAVFPNLGVDVQEAAKLIYFVARKMERTDREFFGQRMLEISKTMAMQLIMAERGHIEWPEVFSALSRQVSELLANISLLATFRLIDHKVLIRLNDALLKVEQDYEKASKDYEKHRNKTAR